MPGDGMEAATLVLDPILLAHQALALMGRPGQALVKALQASRSHSVVILRRPNVL